MKGDRKIIDILNDVLTAELTAINQYFVHAEAQLALIEQVGVQNYLAQQIVKHDS